jgi:Prokaryotic Cytochrome C oxidase subunit IV
VLRDPPLRAWLLLVLATGATYCLRADGFVGFAAGAGTLTIAYVKGRTIILDFMELRQAPLVWRGILEGWLFGVSVLVFAVYWLGQ